MTFHEMDVWVGRRMVKNEGEKMTILTNITYGQNKTGIGHVTKAI
jgi:hypothetical protein